MTEKTRVMYVIDRFYAGGLEELQMITARFLPSEKYEIAFAAGHMQEGFYTHQIRQLGHPLYDLNVTTKLYDFRLVLKLVKVLRKYKPDIVHVYSKGGIMGGLAARMAGVPVVVCSEIDMDWESYGTIKYVAEIKRKSYFLVDQVISCSKAVRDYWDRGNTAKHSVVHLPIDLSKFSQEKLDVSTNRVEQGREPVIGIVSRVCPGKGHEYLIKALPKVLDRFPSIKLKIIGGGPLIGELQTQVSALNLDDTVVFTGFVEDLYAELRSLDVFVLPSLTEGFPLSIMEAMAIGIPVIATSVGGTPEIVEDGVTGYLIPTRDQDALAEAIVKVLSDRKTAKAMGALGMQKVRREFSPEKYVDKLSMIYQDLLRGKGLVQQELPSVSQS